MTRSRRLHVILTVIAILLGIQAWMSISERAIFTRETHAAGDSPAFANPERQRQEIIEALREVAAEAARTNELLESSTLKVEVSNLEALKVDASE